MKKNGNGGIHLDPTKVAAILVAAEVKYLADPSAGPDEVCLDQNGAPHFPPSVLRRNLGRVVRGTSPKDVNRYHVPPAGEVARIVRAGRDRLFMGHTRSGARVRDRQSGQFSRTSDFELQARAYARALEMIRTARG